MQYVDSLERTKIIHLQYSKEKEKAKTENMAKQSALNWYLYYDVRGSTRPVYMKMILKQNMCCSLYV